MLKWAFMRDVFRGFCTLYLRRQIRYLASGKMIDADFLEDIHNYPPPFASIMVPDINMDAMWKKKKEAVKLTIGWQLTRTITLTQVRHKSLQTKLQSKVEVLINYRKLLGLHKNIYLTNAQLMGPIIINYRYNHYRTNLNLSNITSRICPGITKRGR